MLSKKLRSWPVCEMVQGRMCCPHQCVSASLHQPGPAGLRCWVYRCPAAHSPVCFPTAPGARGIPRHHPAAETFTSLPRGEFGTWAGSARSVLAHIWQDGGTAAPVTSAPFHSALWELGKGLFAPSAPSWGVRGHLNGCRTPQWDVLVQDRGEGGDRVTVPLLSLL